MLTCLQTIYLITESDGEQFDDAPQTRTQEIFAKMDLNHDGVLSKEEFIRGCLEDNVLYHMLACKLND